MLKLIVRYDYYRYICVDENTYDGSPDSPNRHMIGAGETPLGALKHWIELYEEQGDV